jgi:phenylacetate-CoA ligase
MSYEDILVILPRWLQNIIISLYGHKQKKQLFNSAYNYYRKIIDENLYSDESDLKNYQQTQLKEILLNASNTNHYQEIFKKLSLDVNANTTLSELTRIPILSKEQLRNNPRDFLNTNYKKFKTLFTSGTTGSPTKIFYNLHVRQKHYAFYSRYLKSIDVDIFDKKATFGGKIFIKNNQNNPPFWRYDHYNKNLLLSSYHITDNNIPSYIQELKEYKPKYIESYPSSIFSLSKFAFENGISLEGITKAIITSAETLMDDQRKIIERVFQTPVFDQYGSVEMCVFIAQCKSRNYHIHTDYGHVEFINKDGNEAKPGEIAEIICTGFINVVMPLIRYRIGDLCVLSEAKCSCGSKFPILEEIVGRKDDVIHTPDGRMVSRLGKALYGLPINEIQIIQREKKYIDVLVVKDRNFTLTSEEKLRQQLVNRIGKEIDIKFKYVDTIDRGPNGKLKTIVSYL